MRRLALLLIAAGFAAGCERPAPPPPAAPLWRLEDVGFAAGTAPWEPFAKLHAVALHPDGRVAVIDIGRKIVTVFAPEGRPLSRAGTVGRGVGQYENPSSVAWLGDTLAVLDDVFGRVDYFTGGGKPSGQTVTLPVSGDPSIRWYTVSPSKAYLRSVRMVNPTTWMSAIIGFQGQQSVDTITVPNPPALQNGARCGVEGGEKTFFQWPESATPLAVPVRADGTIAFAVSDAYHIGVVGPKGDTLAVINGTATPVPVSIEQWTDGLKEFEKFRTRHPEMSCDAEPLQPAHRAIIRGIVASTEGDIWVTVLDAANLRFDVYGPDGKPKASIVAPPHNTSVPISVSGDRVALVGPTGGGGEVVRVLRIVR